MANYSITNPQARLSLVQLVEIPQVAAPPLPWLAVSPDPGPVLADVPPRFGGQPGSWQLPPRPFSGGYAPVGVREGVAGALPPAGIANGTGLLEGLTASLPDLMVSGCRLQLAAVSILAIATPATDINAATPVGSYPDLGNVIQTWAPQALPQHTYYCRFTASEACILNFTASCSDPSASILVGVRDLSGATDRQLTGTGSLDFQATGSPFKATAHAAGDWYIYARIDSTSGGTLTLSGSATKYIAPPGTSTGTAADLGTHTTGVPLTYSLASMTASNHYFQFTAAAGGNRTITLTGLSYDYDLYLLNSAGSQIGSSSAGGSASETITYNCSGGALYYVRVYRYAGTAGPYTVTIS